MGDVLAGMPFLFTCDTVVSALMAKVIQRFPSMEKPWWERCIE
jgi:hypothetical protein